MNKTKELKSNCPKCGNKVEGPILSPSTEIERIDKNDTTISIRGLMRIKGTWQNVSQNMPAWGYICSKCGVLFAISQKQEEGTISNEDMKKALQEKTD